MMETTTGHRRSRRRRSGRDLPEEIILEILRRLPAKSLRRFRRVSTRWRSFIDDPLFVSAHLARSSANPKLLISLNDFDGLESLDPILLKYYRGEGEKRQRYLFAADNSDGRRQVASFYGQIRTSGFDISHSVGGLICIEAGKGIQIYNPTTGDCVTIPKLRFNLHYDPVGFHLGYDPVENKHKIVHYRYPSGFYVLTLGERGWRLINHGFSSSILDEKLSLCVDGIMHMVGIERDLYVLFDVRLETVRVVLCPKESVFADSKLVLSGGRVAVFKYSFDLPEGFVEFWMLEDPEKRVWSCKKFPLAPCLKGIISGKQKHIQLGVGITTAGEMVFAPKKFLKLPYLYLYKVEDASLRKIEMPGLYEHFQVPRKTAYPAIWATVFYHVESLISLRDLRCNDR